MGAGRASDYLYFLSQSAAFLTPDKYDQSWNNNYQKQAKPRLLEPAAHSTVLCWGSGCVRLWSKTCCLKLSYAIETGLHPSWALTIVYDLQAQYHKNINAQRSFVYSRTSRLDFDRGNNEAEVANVFAVPFLIGGFRGLRAHSTWKALRHCFWSADLYRTWMHTVNHRSGMWPTASFNVLDWCTWWTIELLDVLGWPRITW